MAKAPHSKRTANSLVAVGAAAVMAVYAAGYSKTRAAADRFDAQSAGRRPVAPDAAPAPSAAAPVNAEAHVDAPPSQTATISKPALSSVASAAPVANDVAPAAPSAPAETTPAPAPVMVASVAPPAAAVAPPAPVAAPAPAAEPAAKWKDGTYTGWGTCRHGDIQAQVVIEGGRIQNATIAQCLTRYDCNVIGRLPPEVAQRQSAQVDYVSGATQSADAFYYAVLDALSKAK
jgi:uncharacterized protein with FMN-binding domain